MMVASFVVDSVAVMDVSVESVFARVILHGPDVAAWFLHSVLADDFFACGEPTVYRTVSKDQPMPAGRSPLSSKLTNAIIERQQRLEKLLSGAVRSRRGRG